MSDRPFKSGGGYYGYPGDTVAVEKHRVLAARLDAVSPGNLDLPRLAATSREVAACLLAMLKLYKPMMSSMVRVGPEHKKFVDEEEGAFYRGLQALEACLPK